jgi:hemerythrin-like domain-containing protein
MKRRPELRDLSVQHHHGLVAARELSRAAQGEQPMAETVAQFLEAWKGEIQPHFRLEEEVLLPAFAQRVAADDERIVRTLTEHVALRRAVRELEQSGNGPPDLVAEIGRALHDHIRFEERVLFPAVEAALEAPLLAELGRELARREKR